jgi:HSP20 family protein
MTTLIKRKNGPFSSILPEIFNTERLFGPSLLDLEWTFWDTEQAFDVPSANIRETEKEYMVDVFAPGFKKQDFKIEFSEGMLTIHAEKEDKSEETKKDYLHKEFSFSSVRRTFSLPENIKEDKIDALYDNGILHLVLPKKDQGKNKITKEIKVG